MSRVFVLDHCGSIRPIANSDFDVAVALGSGRCRSVQCAYVMAYPPDDDDIRNRVAPLFARSLVDI